MKAPTSKVRGSALILGLLSTLSTAVIGCGSDPKPEAKTATTATSTSSTKTSDNGKATTPPPSSPTASSIHIDDAILKACGIEAPKAHFAFDSANIQSQDSSTLEQVANCFATGPLKGRTLKVIGHADPRGETEYNFVLGNSRADAVGGFLRSKGMDRGKIATTSRGEMDATGTDEEGWARDRRVDLMLGQ